MWLARRLRPRAHPPACSQPALLLVVAFDQCLLPSPSSNRHRGFNRRSRHAAPPSIPLHAYMKEGYLKNPPRPRTRKTPLPRSRLSSASSPTPPPKTPRPLLASPRNPPPHDMPPLEDLIIGGQPVPIGATCAVSIITVLASSSSTAASRLPRPLCVFIGVHRASYIADPIRIGIRPRRPLVPFRSPPSLSRRRPTLRTGPAGPKANPFANTRS